MPLPFKRPTREYMAEFARHHLTAYHDEWDSPHEFSTFHYRPDEGLRACVVCLIDPALPPALYGATMVKAMKEEIGLHEGTEDFPFAFLLQIEAWAIAPKDKHEEAEMRRKYPRHKDNPAAFEQAEVLLCDIFGCVWSASKRRDTGEIREIFDVPGLGLTGNIGGRFVLQMRRTAYATAQAFYKMPAGPMAN